MEPRPRTASFIHIVQSPSDSANIDSHVNSRVKEVGTRSPKTFSRCNIDIKSNKRRQEYTDASVLIENELMQLCRAKDWINVMKRSRSNPEEASPRRIPDTQEGNRFHLHSSKRCVSGVLPDVDGPGMLYFETPLGLACASRNLDSDLLHEVIISLIMACPNQVRANQLIPGHTPLRDAVLNDRCDGVVLQALLDADVICDQSPCRTISALAKQDSNGHRPVDHLMMGVQLGSSRLSLQLFKAYFEHSSRKRQLLDDHAHTPLVRLFTIASSMDTSTKVPYNWRQEAYEDEEAMRRSRVIEATKSLLQSDPSYLFMNSQLTGCSPLHAALRNFGNCLPLIHVLMSRPGANELLVHRNRFGDLPIHVACSVGVPFEVLKVVVDCTIAAAKPSKLGFAFSTHPLLWSINNSGYTPVDLEWVRHIEGGQGFYSSRSFYPLEPSGVRKHCFKQDEYYQDLLREAVDQAMVQGTTVKESDLDQQGRARNIFGSLLDRLSLLISAASCSIPAASTPTLLHNVCKLSALHGPSLPGPLVELFLWIHRGQVLQKDQYGMLPLHYAISGRPVDGTSREGTTNAPSWKGHVLRLLAMEPGSSQISDNTGRLPLHILLDFIGESPDDSASLESIVEELVKCFPESVDRSDPITGLDPFLLAAKNPSFDVEVVYSLLRRSPSRCARRNSAKA